jgi:Gpi18-like mannosyltransferase
MPNLPIDLAAVNWVYVGVLAVFVFLSAFIGNLLSLNHRGLASVLAAIVFAVIFVAWTYFPHGLPLPIRLG